MINIIQLEKRWLRYKTKIYRSLLFILFFLLAIPYLSYYLFQQYNLMVESKDEHNISKVEIQSEQLSSKDELAPKVEKKLTNDYDVNDVNDVLLAPSIPIIDFNNEKKIDRAVEQKKAEQKKAEQKQIYRSRVKREQAYRQKMAKRRELERKRALAKKSLDKKKLVKANSSTALSSSELGVVNGDDIDKKESKKINFNRSGNNYMSIMKSKFTQNKNPREAILISTAYYKAGNYVESEKWALSANNLDENIEESWFLFAKSKAKLGKDREAIKILLSYYKKTKSDKAKELITKIKSGSI